MSSIQTNSINSSKGLKLYLTVDTNLASQPVEINTYQ